MRFRDRVDAGERLAAALEGYRGKDLAVLALPRGGVPVAAVVAAALKAPLGVLLVRKIGVPWEPELAMGAIVDGDAPVVVRNEDVIRMGAIPEADFDRVRRKEEQELERRKTRYLSGRAMPEVAGRTVIIVDDGIATGATMRAAISGLRRREPASIVVATPVAPVDVVARLEKEADAVICLEPARDFVAIGAYYDDFRQLEDEDVIRCLEAQASAPDAEGA